MDELNMDHCYRNAGKESWDMWHGLSPDEEVMAREDEATNDSDGSRAVAMEALLCYVFAEGAEDWEVVAARAVDVMRRWTPTLLVAAGRPSYAVTKAMENHQREHRGVFGLEQLLGLMGVVKVAAVERIMGWIFPEQGRLWLRDGCKRMYLLARAYQPELVNVDGKVASYEDFARVFGELKGKRLHESARARSRWSARARQVLRLPIERTGGRVPGLFGKSVGVREKYRAAAKGNGNRKKRSHGS